MPIASGRKFISNKFRGEKSERLDVEGAYAAHGLTFETGRKGRQRRA